MTDNNSKNSSIKKLEKGKGQVLFAVPAWCWVLCWAIFLLAFLATVGLCLYEVALSQNFWMLIPLVILLVFGRQLSSALIAAPVTASASGKLMRREYLELEKSHRKMLRLLNALPVPKDSTFAALYINIALGQMQRGLSEQAEASLLEGMNYLNTEKKAYRPMAAVMYCNLGCARFRQDKISESLEAYQKALELVEAMPDFYASYKIIAFTGLGIAYSRACDYEKAKGYFQACIDYCASEKIKAINKRSIPNVTFAAGMGLALAYARLKELKRSYGFYDKSMNIYARNNDCGDANCGYILSELAKVYLENGDMSRAETICQLAYKWCSQQPIHPESLMLLSVYEELLRNTRRESEVADMRRWLRLMPENQLAEG